MAGRSRKTDLMTTTAAKITTLPYNYLWEAALRLGTSSATPNDLRLLADGYMKAVGDRYLPDPYRVTR